MNATNWLGHDVILTAGMTDGSTGRRLCGVFRSEADARSEDADELAIAIVSWDSLTPAQQVAAEANSETIDA